MVLKAIVSALAKAAISVQKSKVAGKAVVSAVKVAKAKKISKIAKSLGKILLKKSGFGKFSRALNDIRDLLEYDFKTPMVRQALKNQPFLARAVYFYKKDKVDKWKKIFQKISDEERRIEKDTIKAFKNGDGIEYKEFNSFKNWYLNTLSDQDKEYSKNIFKDKLNIIFDSTWILFAVYIPYGKHAKTGVLGIQIYNQKSKRNPSLYYNYIRVPRRVWEALEDNPTGKTFWDKWLRANRTNRRYLTKKSIHYQKK